MDGIKYFQEVKVQRNHSKQHATKGITSHNVHKRGIIK
jgi:hypothetical protein